MVLLISFIMFSSPVFFFWALGWGYIAGKTPERFFNGSRDPWPLQNCGRALGWGDVKGSGMLVVTPPYLYFLLV